MSDRLKYNLFKLSRIFTYTCSVVLKLKEIVFLASFVSSVHLSSVMSFKELKKIDKRTKYSVYGWLRRQEKSLKSSSIPSMISAICILFYRDDEIFEIISNKGIKISENKKSIEAYNNYKYNNYGMMEIESQRKLIYKWDLKICSGSANIIIGLSSRQYSNTDSYHDGCDNWDGIDYLFRTFSGSTGGLSLFSVKQNRVITYGGGFVHLFWCEYNDPFGHDGDLISLHLDLKEGEIGLIINGKDQGIAFTDIIRSEDIKYRLVVSLSKDSSVEILNFSKS